MFNGSFYSNIDIPAVQNIFWWCKLCIITTYVFFFCRWNFMDFFLMLEREAMKKIMGPNLDGSFTGDPNRPSPKFVKSHLPMSMNNPRLLDTCKVIYVARNPKDVCVSHYYHNRLIRCHDYAGGLEVSYTSEELVTFGRILKKKLRCVNSFFTR